MEWTIGWRPRWLGEVETVELASITRPAWRLRRTQSGCPSKRRGRCLTVPIRFMPVGGSAFTGQVGVRGRPAQQCALVGGVTEQPAGLVRTTPVDPGWREKSACDGHWQW